MIRSRICCRGAVQGVGFRPTVFRLATARGLAGWVGNDPGGVTIEVEGAATAIDSFLAELRQSLPPLARLDQLSSEALAVRGETGFTLRQSELGPRAGAMVPPDAALCEDCRREINDPDDRRFGYPFITCTNCGPRFSLVHNLPYDRQRTAMACFALCPQCAREYQDPGDRRFHAEPVCCPDCGPRLWLANPDGTVVAEGESATLQAAASLLAGGVVAIKGLGGFQLACRADRQVTVDRLREGKRRPSKPFAVMVSDLAAARDLAELSDSDCAALTSARAPVVLVPQRQPSRLAPTVAPGLEDVGLFLPTTPLHVALMAKQLPPLVMTSGNRSDEPICKGNREALQHLGELADLFLLHDRDVVRRVDDSVVRLTAAGPVMVRRARGWVPEPLPLPEPTPRPVLAMGGHLQVTACLAVADQAFLSQHVGDLDSEPARTFLAEVAEGLEEFLEARAGLIVADAHPDYPSTWLARQIAEARNGELVQVQHHLAHAAAVLAEHQRFPPPGEKVLAIVLDGTGWGPDGTAWGGEWLQLGGDLGWQRLGHLQPLPLVGGERAVREPWRVAVAGLVLESAAELLPRLPLAELVASQRLLAVADLVEQGSWPSATGAGRLFEAGGALLGLAATNSYEGEAAVRLESLAATARGVKRWPEVVAEQPRVLPSAQLLAAAARRLVAGEADQEVAAGFFATFCALAADLSCEVAGANRPPLALGGGCMINRQLLTGLGQGLRQSGFEILHAQQVPPGDGGLAYGQAVLAATAQARGVRLAETQGGPG